ncbi:MAG: hypothetical protein QN141_05780 [Armatimonadota bacterium]|nr:hypothetical protein [Armatimonadota bacterium]MDR7452231.1 hypothetical protein [Armatimonadota bacterium]MDR7466674.1 hypothetical protein [Armatimonadota bacterium]MDR7492852.1 hypothetical protein [Armatimonadota bacterium]MDR7498628.1 hypothetical protein [Armatimonadota bacterium]
MPVVDDRETKALRAFQAVRDDVNALERLAARGVRNLLLASGDGLVIDAVTASKTLDLDEIAACAASTLKVVQEKAAGLRLGAVQGIVVEFETGEGVVLDPVNDDAMAIYLADAPAGLDQLGRELPHLARLVAFGAETTAPPSPRAPASAVPRPAAVHLEVPGASAPPPVRGLPRRLILRRAELETVGFTAMALVELSFGDRRVVGRAVGRNIPEQYLHLAAEATVRAITEFLPTGYGLVLENIQPVSSATEIAVWANVILTSPTDEALLPGIARLEGDPSLAAAKTVLSAVNRRLEPVLADLTR